MTQDLLFEIKDNIAVLTLNRPAKLNAFTADMLAGLVAAMDECDERDDNRDLHHDAVVVVASGASR